MEKQRKNEKPGWDVNINARDVIKKGDFSMHFNMVLGNNYNTVLEMDENVLRTHNKNSVIKNGEYLTGCNATMPLDRFTVSGTKASILTATTLREFRKCPFARDANNEVILDSKGNTLPMYFAYGTSASYTFKGAMHLRRRKPRWQY
jgi:hypothetical protein